jgi:ribosomal protein S18 acetylase RimI-like enzyme
MIIEIIEEPLTIATLTEYSSVPIAFQVKSYYLSSPIAGKPSKWNLQEVDLEIAYTKDYDEINDPKGWPAQFELSHWVMLSAFADSKRVGGAVIAWNTPGFDMLEGRSDLAVLWDIRVHPELRGNQIGSLLFTRSMRWAIDRGCRELNIETQNINVPACKFYTRMGCELRAVHEGMYPTIPNETVFIWHHKL